MTSSLSIVLITYLIGGITFIPLCLTFILIHIYLTTSLPSSESYKTDDGIGTIRQSNDDGKTLLSEKSKVNLLEKFRGSHEPDVAAGYFAVCREYVPGGVNGKPPERITPAGIVVGAESPSVYQSMYRSIFDRRQAPTIEIGKADGKPVKRASNVFYVALRHGHLMLYEDSNQLEVKYVISLEHYRISLYGGADEIPEGELWIKKNAIHLAKATGPDEEAVKPFFLFSDNCSDKEDFYFALLRNQMSKADTRDKPPQPLHYDPSHIIELVQRLHSSEEQLQTRWINGLIGRLFLALYKTPSVSSFLHTKITNKIARVKKPGFLTRVSLRKVDMGGAAPHITNPKLRDLTIHGDCCAEADLHYNGNFRLEIAATARLDLGPRFKAREVDLVLAVVVKRLNGHAFLKFKPPPSNRMWISFEEMPDIDLAIEPIVSSRQVTYGLILRTIRSRIMEVVSDTIVMPHWDDIPFTDTLGHAFRGGIWGDQSPDYLSSTSQDSTFNDMVTNTYPHVPADVADIAGSGQEESVHVAFDQPSTGATSSTILPSQDVPQVRDQKPIALRSSSFATVADPLLSNANADSAQPEERKRRESYPDAAASMSVIRNRSRPTSPNDIAGASTSLSTKQACSSASTQFNEKPTGNDVKTQAAEHTHIRSSSLTPSRQSSRSGGSAVGGTSPEPNDNRHSSQPSPAAKRSLATLGAATAMARKLGWGALSRQNRSSTNQSARAGSPGNPIGRGQPLPPLGQPLPSPKGRTLSMPIAALKKEPEDPPSSIGQHYDERVDRPSPTAPVGLRQRRSSSAGTEQGHEGLLVVEAPSSEPPSPTNDTDDAEFSETTRLSPDPVESFLSSGQESNNLPHPSRGYHV